MTQQEFKKLDGGLMFNVKSISISHMPLYEPGRICDNKLPGVNGCYLYRCDTDKFLLKNLLHPTNTSVVISLTSELAQGRVCMTFKGMQPDSSMPPVYAKGIEGVSKMFMQPTSEEVATLTNTPGMVDALIKMMEHSGCKDVIAIPELEMSTHKVIKAVEMVDGQEGEIVQWACNTTQYVGLTIRRSGLSLYDKNKVATCWLDFFTDAYLNPEISNKCLVKVLMNIAPSTKNELLQESTPPLIPADDLLDGQLALYNSGLNAQQEIVLRWGEHLINVGRPAGNSWSHFFNSIKHPDMLVQLLPPGSTFIVE